MQTTLKLSIVLLILTTLIGCASKTDTSVINLITDDTPIYHIKGFKDKRIQAIYSAEFKSTTNIDSDKCGYTYRNTGLRRAILKERMYIASDDNYELKIPIILNDNQDNCNFQFIGLQLDLRRITGDEIDQYYSSYMLLWNEPRNHLTVYQGHRTGTVGTGDIVEMPPTYITDKKYFRIAPDTSFLCRTEWRKRLQEAEPSGDFHCVMKINSGDTKFYPTDEKWRTTVTNPQFGVDEISSSNLTINIIADDNGSVAYDGKPGVEQDRFREYIPPKKSILQKLFN
jgi:hypothetical protein